MKPLALLTTSLLATVAVGESPVVPSGVAPPDSATEVIQQRDATGRVRVRREVRQNDAGDYVNHGSWRAWDDQGQLIGQGRYAWGKPTGVWSRWASADEAPLLATEPFAGFTGPFLSQASYRDGKLEGTWSVFDADGRLAAEIHFHGGSRHGEAVLHTAAGEVFRRSRFEDGAPRGELEQRNADGQLETIAVFDRSRRVLQRSEAYDTGGRKSREAWLGPLAVAVEPDDPWRVRMARYETKGGQLRHGLREAWWPSGQPKLRAEYAYGKAIGTARWWHENGQLALEGAYADGLAEGRWSWWRENGVRAAACRYRAGEQVGQSQLWTADGRRQSPATAVLADRPGGLLIR